MAGGAPRGPAAAAPSRARGKALFTAGILAFYQRDHAAGRRFHEEGLALQRQLGDQAGIAYALFGLAQNAFSRGDLTAARARHEDALAIARQVGDPWQIALSLANLANVVEEQGDHAVARAALEESLAIRRMLHDDRGSAASLAVLGRIVQAQGDHHLARRLYGESLTITRALDDPWSLVHALAGLAGLTEAEGSWTLSLQLASAAATVCETSGCALFPGWPERTDRKLERARQALGPAASRAAWEEGRAGSIGPLVAAALGVNRPHRSGASAERTARLPQGTHASAIVPLTRREREVAALIARGCTNREVATALVITERTAATHVEHILNKLGVTSRAQVAG